MQSIAWACAQRIKLDKSAGLCYLEKTEASFLEFEWDEKKNKENIRKHGISFELAKFVFNDANRVTDFDELHSKDEDRWFTIGLVGKVLYVVYTERNDKTRIISARLANSKEKDVYYGNGALHLEPR